MEMIEYTQHRDLHWGQILVKNTTSRKPPRVPAGQKVPMDHDAHGVEATVIDLGLSRMLSGEGDGVHFTIPDEEVFEGEGSSFYCVLFAGLSLTRCYQKIKIKHCPCRRSSISKGVICASCMAVKFRADGWKVLPTYNIDM